MCAKLTFAAWQHALGCARALGRRRCLSSASVTTPWVRPVGEGALLLRFGNAIDLEVNRRVLAYMSKLDQAPPLDGVREVLPAYASLLVHFDPLAVSSTQVEWWCEQAATLPEQAADAEGPRVVSIPVRYGGEHGPDIDAAAEIAGLGSAAEVARVHSEAEYRVYFLGFTGGFPYLGGLHASLASVPRLATPRQSVPKGAVGIAAGQTGVYPLSTPGGWHVLGRSPASLFDPRRDQPAMLRAGDLVRFMPLAEGEAAEAPPLPPPPAPAPARPWVEVVSPGPLTTVQDLGRRGYARHGVSRSGAADGLALRMGNALLGNDEGAAGLEVTMGGLALRCVDECAIALTGADCGATISRPLANANDGPAPLRTNEVIVLRPDDDVRLGYAGSAGGIRAYVCVQGGVDVPRVLGSRSTDVRAAMGGLQGRPLRATDALGRVRGAPAPPAAPAAPAATATPEGTGAAAAGAGAAAAGAGAGPARLLRARHDPLGDALRAGAVSDGGGAASAAADAGGATAWELRVLAGPGDPGDVDRGDADVDSLLGNDFAVLPRSDRMAVCLALASPLPLPAEEHEGAGAGAGAPTPPAPLQGGQQLSEACVSGTVQLPPDGNPLILLAEHQTTGGYKVPGVVIEADLWRVGQMRPGDRLRFVLTTAGEAAAALRRLHEDARQTDERPPYADELDLRGMAAGVNQMTDGYGT